MLVIRATSFKGRPLGQELSSKFGEAGGTIGRGENSTLVLPDAERFISRTHATVSFQAGGFIITDNGTKNAVLLNGQPLGQGNQAKLANGDQIRLGDYTLEVELTAPNAPVIPPDPFGGLRPAEAMRPPDLPRPVAPPPLLEPPVRHPDPWKPAAMDPVAAWPGAPAPQIAQPPPVADPFASVRGREPSIDELFGLKPSKGNDPLAIDPFDALIAPPARPAPTPSVPDHGPELFAPYTPPVAKPDPLLQPKADALLQPKPDLLLQPKPDPLAQPKSDPLLQPRSDAPPRSEPVTPPPQRPAPVPQMEPATKPPSRVPAGSSDEALLRAFLRGAGIPEASLPKGLTPETIEAIGKLLRDTVQGTLDLLRARGLTKSEMRADVTMITPLDNNPLKFSPTVDAALVHLLAPHVPGFMPPSRAMKDAYDDLRAHQLALFAGMRAALDEVLTRFSPADLDKRLSETSLLDNVLPMNRRARLWDLFVERHTQVSAEVREDFNAVFGKAFRRAYEAQIKQLRGGEGRPS